MSNLVKQVTISTQTRINENQGIEELAFFNSDGSPKVFVDGHPKVVSVDYASEIVPDSDTTDILNVGVLTSDLSMTDPVGDPVDGQSLRVRFEEDSEGGWVITWDSSYVFGTDVTADLIPIEADSKWEQLFTWHAGDSVWRAIAIVRGF